MSLMSSLKSQTWSLLDRKKNFFCLRVSILENVEFWIEIFFVMFAVSNFDDLN